MEANEIKPEDLLSEIEQTQKEYSTLHRDFIKNSQVVGFGLEILEIIKQNYKTIISDIEHYEEYKPLIAAAYNEFKLIRELITKIRQSISKPIKLVGIVTSTVYSTYFASGSVAYEIYPELIPAPELPSFINPKIETVIEKLDRLDPALTATYQQIEQSYYGTNADNVRTAMMVVRQAFDHYFAILAPDNQVRKSRFWKPKSEKGKENQVTREERLNYAISKHIKDQSVANLFIVETVNIINTYEFLNHLHKRGSLNLEPLKKAIFAMKYFIEKFTEAID